MKKIAYILSFIFLSFVAGPTIISLLDDSVDVSFAFTANEDFPDLRESDMRVRQYDGETTRGFFGIEFLVPPESVPDSYKRVERLEFHI